VKIAEKSLKIGQLVPILGNFSQFEPHFMNLNQFLKKVGRKPSHDLFLN
jgi:hypothetical protein